MKQKWNETIFERGQWIKDGDGDILRVKGYKKRYALIITYPTTDGLTETEHCLEECELWKPRKNEWCWFHIENSIPTLARYSRKEKALYIGCVKFKNGTKIMVYSNKIEPFIRELPTYLKG